MKKRILSAVIAIVLCFATAAPLTAAAETSTPYWQKTATVEGRELTLTVKSKNAAGIIAGGTVELKYDTDVLEYIGCDDNDTAKTNGAINPKSTNSSIVANFASATAFSTDCTLITAKFSIKDGKICSDTPFTIVRDKLVSAGDGAADLPKQVNVDSNGKTVSPSVEFTCAHTESNWVITKQPTSAAKGERVKKCTACGKILETEELDPVAVPYWQKTATVSGRTLTLKIESKNAAGLAGGGTVELQYDPDVLEYVGCKDTDTAKTYGTINPKSTNNSIIANFASAVSFSTDCTLLTATFNIKDGKVCGTQPFKVIRDMLACSGDGTSANLPKQINVDANGEVVSPDVEFTCPHETTKTDTVESTCIKEGYTSVTCTVCGYEISRTYLPLAEHIKGNWEITKQPTTTEVGEKVIRCVVCKKILETKEIDKVISAISYWKKTATLNGKTLTLKIESVNGANRLHGGTVELQYNPEVLEFKKNDNNTYGKTLEGISCVNGLTDRNTIIVNLANATANENDGILVIAEFTIKDGKTCASNPFTIIRDNAAGFDSTGKIASINIGADGKPVMPEVEFTCLHSDTVTKTVPSTCTEVGHTIVTCTDCGIGISDTEIPKLSHTWNSWAADENGNVFKTCSVCGEHNTDETVNIKNDFYLAYASALITDSINLKFFISDTNKDFNAEYTEDAGIALLASDNVSYVSFDKLNMESYNNTQYYTYTIEMYAYQMTDKMTIRPYIKIKDGTVIFGNIGTSRDDRWLEYDVSTYLSSTYGNKGNPESYREFAIKFANYGAALQKEFSYNSDHLANDWIEDENKKMVDMNAYRSAENNVGEISNGTIPSEAKISWAISIDSTVQFSCKLENYKLPTGYKLYIADNPSDIESGKAVQMTGLFSKYSAKFDSLSPQRYADIVSKTLYIVNKDGDVVMQSGKINFSVTSYIYNNGGLSSHTESYRTLLNSMQELSVAIRNWLSNK